MSDNLRMMRFYFWLLALFTVGRWTLGLAGVDYSKAHQVFSLVTLALIASAHHAAFARAYEGWGVQKAIGLGMSIGFVTQVVIFVSTALSYLLDLHTYFNAPRALNSPTEVAFGAAMGARAFGVVVNTILGGIAASLGWAMGRALPARQG